MQGDYPYPSSYILNGLGELPAYPVRVACDSLGQKNMAGDELLAGLAGAVGVFYNYSGSLSCLDYTKVTPLDCWRCMASSPLQIGQQLLCTWVALMRCGYELPQGCSI